MPKWPSVAADWMRRLFVSGERSEAPYPGHAAVLTGAQAVVATEALISEGLYRFSVRTSEGIAPRENAFGARVESRTAQGNGGATTAAGGLALSGRRAAVFLSGAGIVEAAAPLSALSARHVPLVLHVTDRIDPLRPGADSAGHGSYHAVATLGAVVLVARDAQHAVDLTLVARRVAEEALVPCVVAMDAAETAWAPRDVALPDPELIRSFLGRPEQEIETPTPAQHLLFGERRRRVPAWFDLDRPVAHGVAHAGRDLAAAIAGQRLLFGDHVEAVLRSAMEALSLETGRHLSPASLHEAKGAKHVLVATGAAVETAEAVADHLGNESRQRISVLGITALRPFPAETVRETLAGTDRVTVLERADDPLCASGPLTREVRASLPGAGPRLRTATYGLDGQPIEAADLAALCAEDASDAPPLVHLGIVPPDAETRFPTRQVHLEAIRREYPSLGDTLIAATEPLDLTPKDARVVTLWQRAADPAEDWLAVLAAAMHGAAGEHIRAHTFVAEEGVQVGRVMAGAAPFRDPGSGVRPHIALIDDLDLTDAPTPLAQIRDGGEVVLATPLSAEALWTALPATWREVIRDHELRVYTVEGGARALVEAAGALLSGDAGAGLTTLEWSSLSTGQAGGGESRPPAAVERFRTSRAAYDNVPHFWNTVVAPRLGGEEAAAIPDPLLSVGAVPPSTSAFHDAGRGRSLFPRVDPHACIGCGDCWVACPDSAIASVAIGVGGLLDATADMAAETGGEPSEAAGKLRRAHRQLAARLDGMLAKADSGSLPLESVREAYDWLVDKMGVSEDDRSAMGAAFEATHQQLELLPLSVTDLFFKAPHAEKKGSGELIMLAIDPRSCQACGGCATSCAEDAITMEPERPEDLRRAEAVFRAWTHLPDTSGESIVRAAGKPEVGPLAALLMSRHCLGALAGGDFAEPGSGERLALRLVAAIFEHRSERRFAAQLADLAGLRTRVRDAIRTTLAESLSSDDLAALNEALGAVPSRPANLGALVGRLDELGVRNTLDRDRARALVSVARELELLEQELGQGSDGLGRSRFGVVLAGESVGRWAARFPRNPFAAPVAVDLTGNGPELAEGILAGLNAGRVEEAVLTRRAELLLAAPSDLALRDRELSGLTWRDLTPEERAARPPLIVVVGPEAVTEHALPSLSRLLGSDHDIKVLLLDGRDRVPTAADPVLLALSHRRAFVLSTSIAHPTHLSEGLDAALSFQGPALIHIHAPSPRLHGFPADQTVERARIAVACRVQPLLRYDPEAAGVYGARLSLAGNPQPAETWAFDADGRCWTPARWALGEARFAGAFTTPAADAPSPTPVETWSALERGDRAARTPTIEDPSGSTLAVGEGIAELSRERFEHYRVLSELAGVVTPFTGTVRAEVEAELSAAHGAQMEALRAEWEAKLALQQQEQEGAMAARLKARLLELSGLPSTPKRPRDENGAS